MSDQSIPRRSFLKTAAAGAAGAVFATSSPAYSYSRIQGANSRVRVGVIGYSDRFRGALIPAMQANAKALNFEFVAVSDIWNRRRDEAVAGLEKATGRKITAFRNNEELYASRSTDAVIISTADFQHALHGVEAMQAGQDAYIEKPLANTLEDAKAIREAVRRSGRIVQIGTQRRSSPKYQLANEFIKSGKFGDIVMAEMTWNVNQPSRWRRPQAVSQLREQDTDWRRYLMNRPYEPFDARKYLEFRLFWPFSSGIPDQWLVHQIDTVHWFTDLPHPRSVVANGGIYQWKDGRRNWDTLTIVFDYGPLNDPSRGFQVTYSSRMNNSAGGVKEYYYSNGGMLNLETGEVTPEGGLQKNHAEAMGMQERLLPKMKLSEAAGPVATDANTGGDSETTANMRNWMESVISRKKPNADIEAGYNHSLALVMTIAAMQTGKKVTFDDAKQQIVTG
ncbi:MAG: Gfo/Idh/MocA family oxidoreductase [Gemmatimonadetes bacterium]|nr:Gfo/Idh/MocA family oxidoreductase [Gemmatimonadota bacterium]